MWLVVGWLLDGADRRPVASASAEIAEHLVTGVATTRLTLATDSSK